MPGPNRDRIPANGGSKNKQCNPALIMIAATQLATTKRQKGNGSPSSKKGPKGQMKRGKKSK